MPNIQSQIQCATVNYDFATQGGGVGTFNLGAILPVFSVIWFASIESKLIMNSAGGLATVEFGIQPRGSAAAPTTDALFAAALANSYLPATGGYGNNALNVNPLCISSYAAELTMTVAVEAITSGRLLLTAYYIEKKV